MMTILHLITDLGRGGAQSALARLVMGMERANARSVVVSLKPGGAWADALREAGVEVRDLGFLGLGDALTAHAALQRLLRETTPDIVQSWLYHADLMATLARPRKFGAALGWNVRNSDLAASGRADWRLLTFMLARLSRAPDFIVANAQSGLEAHRRIGYRPRKAVLIPNGIDTEAFRPEVGARAKARAALNLPADAFIIGMAARYDSFKDHRTFIAAAERLDSAHFVLAGAGAGPENAELARLIADAGLGGRVHTLGDVSAITSFYQALDVATLGSSHGEAFPNAIAEAMACGVPVAATDVGDVREIVGEAGIVMPPRAPQALARAWETLAAMSEAERTTLGQSARARIVNRYGLAAAIRTYETLYREVLEARASRPLSASAGRRA